METKSLFGLKGVVEKRLFDTHKLRIAQRKIRDGCKDPGWWLEWAAKPLFASNWLWSVLNKLFGIDWQIPYLTGVWAKVAISANLVPTRGKQVVAEQVGGTTTSPVTAIALGIGSGGPAAGDTALNSEITTNGGERGAASVSNTTTTTTDDTEQWQKIFSFTGGFAVTEEGLLDNNAAGGLLLARQLFSAINVVSGDSLQISHRVQAT